VLSAGDVTGQMFPRSSNKPFQAAAMLRCGLDVAGELLALVAASHAGEPFHVGGVREILSRAGLTEEDLQCPAAMPGDPESRRALVRADGKPARIYMNCSGKHAGMLATCAAAGWPTASYRDPDHPCQREVARVMTGLAREAPALTGVDGCGAPIFGLSLTGLARAFRALVLAAPGTPERRVADAMRAHPAWASGTHRVDRALMVAVPGLLLKSGAEGVQAFALPDGRAAAFKIEDGSARAVPGVAVALLRAFGVAGDPGQAPPGAASGGTPGQPGGGRWGPPDAAALADIADLAVRGGDDVVGHIRIRLPG